ncbi:hypothetical protein GCM10010278_62400 [Streptomyces melanogenes]|nr:hypothetical protein GCM10010278_62400 [Streptomyces melanogenes]
MPRDSEKGSNPSDEGSPCGAHWPVCAARPPDGFEETLREAHQDVPVSRYELWAGWLSSR